jgi:hypothetical protein
MTPPLIRSLVVLGIGPRSSDSQARPRIPRGGPARRPLTRPSHPDVVAQSGVISLRRFKPHSPLRWPADQTPVSSSSPSTRRP